MMGIKKMKMDDHLNVKLMISMNVKGNLLSEKRLSISLSLPKITLLETLLA